MSDDATKAYRESYAQDEAPEPTADQSRAARIAAIKERIAARVAERAAQPASDGSTGGAPGGDQAAAPAAPDPNLIQPEPLAPDSGIGTARDIYSSTLRGPIKGMANMVDFGARALDGTLEYLGVPEDTFYSGTRTGDLVDKYMGKPETTAGAVTQGVAELVVPLKAIFGPLSYASKAKAFGQALFGSALLQTSLTSDKATNLSNIAQSMPEDHWSNNWVTEMLALEHDDNGFQKFTKRLAENLILNDVTERTAGLIGSGLGKLRGLKKDVGAVADTATEAGLPTAPKVEQAIKDAAAAQHEADVVQAVAEDAKPAAQKSLTGQHAELAAHHEATKTTLEDVATSITAAETSLKGATTSAEKKALKAHIKELEGQRQVLMDEIKTTEGRLNPEFVDKVGQLEALDSAVESLSSEAQALRQQLDQAQGLAKGPIAKRLKKIVDQLDAATSERTALKGGPTQAKQASDFKAPTSPAPAAAAGDEVLRTQLRDLRGQLANAPDDATATALRSQIDDVVTKLREQQPQAGAQQAPQQGAQAPQQAAQTAPEAPVVPPELQGGIDKKVKATADEAFDRTENIVKGIEELDANHSPEYLKGLKESAIDGGIQFSPEQIARIDAAIASKTEAAALPLKDKFFGAHLAMTADQMKALRTAFLAGDFKGATETLGKAIGDTTNFSKIAASGDVTDLLATMMEWFGKDENSYRLLESRSRAVTYASAQEEIQALATKYGSDADSIRRALETQFPKRDLTKVLTAYRILEASVAQQSLSLAKLVRFGGSGGMAAEQELTRMLALTGIINDRRAGLVSDIARSLNSLQHAVEPTTRVLRSAAAEARNMGYEQFIQTHGGGRKNVQRLAEMIVAAGNPEQATELVGKAAQLMAGTLGDSLYAFVIHNTLSGPLSALKNLSSSAFYQGVWKPWDNMWGAVARDLHAAASGGDVVAIRKEVRRIRATYAAARKSLATDSIIRRNMAQAWETGQRVTTAGGAFTEHAPGGVVTRLGEGNYARATELARTLRDGGQFKLPAGPRIKLGAALLGQNRLNKMASALDASAQTRRLWSPLQADPGAEIAKRYGFAAKVIDYTGRVNSWAMHGLATGDEWNSAIARSGALEAEAFEAVNKLRLPADEAEAMARDMIDNIHTIPDLLKKADDGALTPSQLRRLDIMQEISEKADDYVREITFTQTPDAVTKQLAGIRANVPGARWLMYFVRTPGNITKAGALNTPVGRFASSAYALAAGDKAMAAEQIGRAASAGALALAGFELVTNGQMTGSGPSDPEANALWQSIDQGGNKPYIMRIPTPAGPVELNYGSFIDPVAIPLQVMAELVEAHQYMDEPTFAGYANEFNTRFMKLLESKSYLGSVTDAIDLVSGRGDLSKAMVRIGRNFVPQARLLSTLRTNGLPVPPGVGAAVIGAKSEDDTLMSLQEFIDGQKYKDLIDRGTGVKLNEKGELVDVHGGIIDSPMVVNFVSTVAEDMPDFVAEPWLEMHARLLGVRAQHGKFVQRDQLGEKRVLPIGYGPQHPSGLLGGKTDPVRQELIDVGMDKSVGETFGQFMGQELTPEQQDFYQRRYRRPSKGDLTATEMFAKAIASEDYKKLGETVGNTKGGRYKFLNALHESRMGAAQARLLDKFPELRAVFLKSMQQKAQMMTKQGSDAFAAEQAARAPALLQAFEGALNGSDQ